MLPCLYLFLWVCFFPYFLVYKKLKLPQSWSSGNRKSLILKLSSVFYSSTPWRRHKGTNVDRVKFPIIENKNKLAVCLPLYYKMLHNLKPSVYLPQICVLDLLFTVLFIAISFFKIYFQISRNFTGSTQNQKLIILKNFETYLSNFNTYLFLLMKMTNFSTSCFLIS